eukprot:TRINITY_DN11472_c0_g1_i3.p1 TRINITY_DN11472_c0_g1~~TRINITY_DN11472_c0_g1_i3.p1  ORF type:complete len:140 (+),score=18.20 TRINITY_DN11472_c0_g1_i3:132-551(+)
MRETPSLVIGCSNYMCPKCALFQYRSSDAIIGGVFRRCAPLSVNHRCACTVLQQQINGFPVLLEGSEMHRILLLDIRNLRLHVRLGEQLTQHIYITTAASSRKCSGTQVASPQLLRDSACQSEAIDALCLDLFLNFEIL